MMPTTSFDELVEAAKAMVDPGHRRLLGITGAPGSGKSSLAEALVSAIGPSAALVPLDGFHLADEELHRLQRHPRKGAADTFDAHGYIHLLRRLRQRKEDVIYAPRFDRSLEAAIAGSLPIPTDTPLIITEGNYLLLDTNPWHQVADLLDARWYVDPGHNVRMERLIARHMRFGRTAEQAHERSWGSDEANAELIETSRARCDRVVQLGPDVRLL